MKKIKITHKLDFSFLYLAGTPVDKQVPNTVYNDFIAISYLPQEYVFLYPVIRNRRIWLLTKKINWTTFFVSFLLCSFYITGLREKKENGPLWNKCMVSV